MELSPEVCSFIRQTAETLSGAQRRRYMAQAVEQLRLSQRQAQRYFGWARDTLRKAAAEAAGLGLGGIMLYGVPQARDAVGSGATDPEGLLNPGKIV